MKTPVRIAALILAATSALQGAVRTEFNPTTGLRYDTAFVTPTLTIEKQQGWLWCWAAAISTIFKHYGYRVPQAAIVERIKGIVVDQAGWPQEMVAALSSEWIDSRGRTFRVTCQVHDVMSGVSSFTNDDIMNDLAENHPILYCNSNHAMVLVKAVYEMHPNGFRRIVHMEVLDPAPGVPSPRVVNFVTERFPFFAARIRVEG